MNLQEISAALGGNLIGDPDYTVTRVASLTQCGPDTLTFILSKSALKDSPTKPIYAAVTFTELPDVLNQIVVPNPRKAMAQAILLFHPGPASTGFISPHAFIHPTAVVAESARIMEFVSVGADAEIGDDCVLYPNVTIYPHSILKNRVRIHSGSVIGSDGFGYYSDQGHFVKMPHIGRVIIHDDVEIGANTTVDRGVLDDTTIGRGTKIDNLVHIAHNTQIGENSAIAAQVGLMGHASVGSHVQIGGQAGIGAARIGDQCVIAGRAGVTRDIPPKSMVSGFPAWEHQKELRKEAWIRQQFQKRKDPK